MDNDKIMKALFAQQRAQILHIKQLTPDLLPNSYVYAWMNGLYPFFHDGDDSVPDYPHENFTEHFKISAAFGMEVIKYLDNLWLEDKSPTFYELENQFGGKDARVKLLRICHYAYLDGRFDDRLWHALLTKMQHPSEASLITSEFTEDSLYIL